jgi:hypothetical protein
MLLNHFEIDNPIYGMARISVWLANTALGEMPPTQVLAMLYSDAWSDTQLGNPVKLTARGRWPQPVYVDAPVYLVCQPARHEQGAGVLQTYLANNPPPTTGWGASPG